MEDNIDLMITPNPEAEQKPNVEDGPLRIRNEEREKDNRAEAFRALKKLGRGRRR